MLLGTPRLKAHFLPKFDNQSEGARLKHDPNCVDAKCLAVTKKHSGHLVMAPPFYSKNGCANRYSRMGALLLRAHFVAVFPGAGDERFAAWWAHAEENGLCYSFECVVPRILGDHGATPEAAYMVLTCISHTGSGGTFLSPAQLLKLATVWRLPVNEVTFVPWAHAGAVEDALHAARWTMLDADASALLAGQGVQQRFLSHGETQGSVLEGFVLMALDASAEELAPLVAEYYAATAGARAAALATALEWGGACVRREPWVLELLDTPMTGREPEHIEGTGQRGRGAGQQAVWVSACEGDESSPLCALFRRLQAVYAHRVTLKAYNYNGCRQLQVDVGDDQIFFGWKMHIALGGVAPLYRGMVVQYDGFEPPPLDVVMATADAHAWGADVVLSTAVPPTSLPGARVLGIAKLKCLHYLMRTFGVRNQLPMLIDRGAAAYVAATERFLKIWGVPTEHHERLRTTFSQWAREVALLGEGERRTLHNGEYLEWLEPFLKGERRSAAAASFGLERFLLLIVNLTGAALPPEIARDYAPGMTPCRMHDAHQLARAGSVMVLEQPPSGRQFQAAAGTPTLVLLFPPRADAETKWHKMLAAFVVLLALPPGGGKSTFYDALRRAGAAVASSDDERVRGGKFDSVLASLLQKHELVGYDKNVPNADGLAKLFKVLGSVENEHRIAVRVIPVVPAYLDHDIAWARVGARTASHHALNIHTIAGGESEAYNVFKNIFFDACTAFQPQAAQLPGAIVSDAFWRYILAKAKAFAADLPSARAGEKRSGPGSTTERRVAFWEVSAIDGLPAALQFKLQQEIYHVTDTASLVGCAPRDAAEVLRALRSGDLSPEWDVTSIGPTTPAEVFAQVRIVS